MKRPIEDNSTPGQAVYEPFSGSGTTIIAAEMTGRSCHAIELSLYRNAIGELSASAGKGNNGNVLIDQQLERCGGIVQARGHTVHDSNSQRRRGSV
jgi:hypothetical protein